MNQRRQSIAVIALERIALREGKTTGEVREEIHKAILIGLCSQDPHIQACWKRIPCQGSIPTPEDVILFLASEAKSSNK